MDKENKMEAKEVGREEWRGMEKGRRGKKITNSWAVLDFCNDFRSFGAGFSTEDAVKGRLMLLKGSSFSSFSSFYI